MINAINLIDVLGTSKRELSEVINNIDDYYYNFRQAKTKYGEEQKRGSRILFRELWPSQFALKRIQKRINLLLQMKELPEYVYGSVRGSNNFLNALAHIENKYFFSVDLKNFFPNITHRQVFKMFVRQGFSSSAARKLTKLTTYRGSLPREHLLLQSFLTSSLWKQDKS